MALISQHEVQIAYKTTNKKIYYTQKTPKEKCHFINKTNTQTRQNSCKKTDNLGKTGKHTNFQNGALFLLTKI